jgi:hypothetical protein
MTSPVWANEIPGTRVEGQGAVCAEGQGKALEVNIALKKEFSYCIELPKPTPTPAPVITPAPTPTVSPTSEPTVTPTSEPQPTQTNEPVPTSNTETTTATTEPEPTPTVTPTPTPKPTVVLPSPPQIPERSNVIEADVTKHTVVVREETIEEWLDRIFRGWSSWYEALIAWWLSLNA